MPSPLRAVLRHLHRHVGAGILCAVGYFDPGNWSVDIQAGTNFGYRPMLFVILLSGLMAVAFQVLATRLGCVTGLDIACHCRIFLHDHPRYPRLVRWLTLYPLYILAELAIIATDLAELLGSAIGFTLLFPTLPLWAGVLLTGADVFVFLLINDGSHSGRPVRLFEVVIILLVAAVFVCFIVLVVKVNPDWSQAFLGYVPNSGLFETQPNAIYTAIGIIGATVMPHGLFLGSHLSTQDRISSDQSALPSPVTPQHTSMQAKIRQRWREMFRFVNSDQQDHRDLSTPHELRQNNSISFIRAHLTHAIVDVVASLIVLAIPINSAILILSAAVLHDVPTPDSIGLYSMHTLILQTLGKGAALIFALALVCAGQAASVTATLAGQIVSEGFILWKISPFWRRLLTRLISLIPAMVVAIAFGRAGLNSLLVASQVALSVVLPFVAFPLIYFTSSKTIMSVKVPSSTLEKDEPISQTRTIESIPLTHTAPSSSTPSDSSGIITEEVVKTVPVVKNPTSTLEAQPDFDTIDFSNSFAVSAVAYAIGLVILISNVYAIVMVGKGRTG